MNRQSNPLTTESPDVIEWGQYNRRLREYPRDRYAERVKYLRKALVGDEFSAANGFNLHDRKHWTGAQKAKITKVFERRDPATKREREQAIDTFNLVDRVKKLRPYFGDKFKAKNGYDLRRIDEWTPAKKAKVTEYYRVMAPRLAGNFVVKRYRRKDHLKAAVAEAHQEKLLPGQKAVLFSVDPGEKLNVKFTRRGRALVSRNNVEQDTLLFDKQAFIDDPESEIDRVLSETDANVFRIVTGDNESLRTFTRSDLAAHIFKLIRDYSEENVHHDWEFYENWLNGIVAYRGTVSKVKPKLDRKIAKHMKESREKRMAHDRERAQRRRAYTRRELLKGR